MFILSGAADSKRSAEEVEEQRLSDAHAHSGAKSCGATGSLTITRTFRESVLSGEDGEASSDQ